MNLTEIDHLEDRPELGEPPNFQALHAGLSSLPFRGQMFRAGVCGCARSQMM